MNDAPLSQPRFMALLEAYGARPEVGRNVNAAQRSHCSKPLSLLEF
jgi:hypothetical protein